MFYNMFLKEVKIDVYGTYYAGLNVYKLLTQLCRLCV
jgi:hypothetical protein